MQHFSSSNLPPRRHSPAPLTPPSHTCRVYRTVRTQPLMSLDRTHIASAKYPTHHMLTCSRHAVTSSWQHVSHIVRVLRHIKLVPTQSATAFKSRSASPSHNTTTGASTHVVGKLPTWKDQVAATLLVACRVIDRYYTVTPVAGHTRMHE